MEDKSNNKKAMPGFMEPSSYLKNIFKISSNGMAIVNEKGKWVDFNESFARMLGYSPKELRELAFTDLTPKEFAQSDRRMINQVLRQGHFDEYEKEYIRKDGTRVWVSISGGTLEGFTEDASRDVFVFIKDITEIKKIRELLQISHNGLKKKIDEQVAEILEINLQLKQEIVIREQAERELTIRNQIANIFLTISDEEMYWEVLRIILKVTKSKYGAFGYINEDGTLIFPSLTRDVWDECKVPDKSIIFPSEKWNDTIWARAIKEKKLLYSNKPSIHIPQGHLPILRNIAVPIVYQGVVIGLIQVANKETDYDNRDIYFMENIANQISSILNARLQRDRQGKEKEKMQSQVFQMQKLGAIGKLAGGVAHDFNNLLAVIMGRADFLLCKIAPDNPICKDIEKIKKAGERAAALVYQLLAFSRKQPLQVKILNLNDIVTTMGGLLNTTIGEDIEVITVLEPALENIKTDQSQMEQVVINFVANARDSMPKGGKLIIKTENVSLDEKYCKIWPEARQGRFVCLSIEDTGSGMDKETLKNIFEPFFTTKEFGSGAGLGLSVVYGIVKQHEGWINVYSEPGQGTVFKIYLPVFEGKQEDAAEKIVLAQDYKGSGERILLVEDEPELRDVVVDMLHRNGYVVFKSKDAKEAIDIFEKEKGNFSLVLSDVILPDKSGIELADHFLLRKPGMKIILSSGYTDDKSQWPVISERGLPYLQKPYSLSELLKTLREVIERPE